MTTINQLAYIDSDNLQTGDQILFFSTTNGCERRTSLNDIVKFINANASIPNKDVKQYVAPIDAFNLALTDTQSDLWLILTPSATLATGTIILPDAFNTLDQKEITINSSQIITSLAFNLNGATAGFGLPNTIATNGFCKIRFDGSFNNWYRVA